MLKRINVQHVTLGMFLHEFCGSWMEHPFWRTRFLLRSEADLQRLRSTSIQEVWIDVRKGLDVGVQVPCLRFDPQDELRHQIPDSARPVSEQSTAPISTATELRRAAQTCVQAKQLLSRLFSDARLGRPVDATAAGQLVDDVTASVARNPHALIGLARLKTADDYTYMHSVAVCALMIVLARQLDLPPHQVRQAGYAGLLHDIGKMAIATSILNKPGRLTDQEFDEMREHPARGLELLKASGVDDPVVLDVCLHHHEKVDGTGYPHRLRGEDISLLAKMGAVCDVYDAITSDRPYKRGWDPAEAVHRMAEWSTGHFDKTVFQAFVKSIGIYPVGSLVRLTTGRLGVVVDPGRQSLTCPQVKVFYSTASGMRIPPETIDLARPGCQEKISSREDPAKWGFTDIDALWKDQT